MRPAGRTHLAIHTRQGGLLAGRQRSPLRVEIRREQWPRCRPDRQESHVRRPCRMRRPISSKSDICTEGMDDYAAGIKHEGGGHYPWVSPCLTSTMACTREYGGRQRGWKSIENSAEGTVVVVTGSPVNNTRFRFSDHPVQMPHMRAGSRK